MKIFDCFMYFDEDLVLDLRLNYLDKFVDKFIIVESKYNHNGEERKPLFDVKKFQKFKDKIIYIFHDQQAPNLMEINENLSSKQVSDRKIMNALRRENFQRNFIEKGLKEISDEDWIIVSDLDEIPNLENINFKNIRDHFIFFKQLMIYYKFNLILENYSWTGSKACKKKHFKSPQWLRNIKDRNYPLWRIDTYFSDHMYSKIKIVENGGWHFSYIKSPEDIEKKLKSYLHHREYELNPLGIKEIKKRINEKKTVYNLKVDTKKNKFNDGNSLKKIDIEMLPSYIRNNKEKFIKWMEE